VKKEQPLVSIIINNYNYENFLCAAIDSVLNQTYLHTELIVVDDGSTDNSRQIIASYGNKIIPVFKKNEGQASAFNAGFAVSQGDIICFLDSDDVFVPEKVTEIVKVFTDYPDIDWCFHSLKMIDKHTGDLVGINREHGSRKCDFRLQMKHGKLLFYAPPTSSLCFKRSLLEQILPMTEMLKRGADRYLVTLAPALSKGFFLDSLLTIQGIHDNNGNTLKSGKICLQRRAYKAIIVAYFLRIKLPEFSRLANRIFARGLSAYWKLKNIQIEEKEYIKKYYSLVSFVEKMEIFLMALYQNRPWKQSIFGKKFKINKN
jgi:glycosyltransferase involved in cell wall biosynthesis